MDETQVEEVFGASGAGLSMVEKVRLLAEWAPLLPLLQVVAAAQGSQAKAVAFVGVLKWLATKTQTPTDDAALDHLEAALRTPEAGKVIDFLVALLGAVK